MTKNRESKWNYLKNKILVLVGAIVLISVIIFGRGKNNPLFKKEGLVIPNACILTTEEIYIEELKPEIPVVKPVEEKPKKEYVLRNYNYVEPTGTGNSEIVAIAKSQVGNIGGEIYWKWYGFKKRAEWCGIFISWAAKEVGISESVIPKFAKANDGARWFMNHSLFRNRNYTPREGDLIFFDWDMDGVADHVGIVSSIQNKKVYTIEGNREDECKEKVYPTNSDDILGYGTPNY